MSKEIDNIFIDVRNAFRLLTVYQERVLDIVDYIRQQAKFDDMWGSKNWFSDEIRTKRKSPYAQYAKLNVFKDMWGLDFLYGHFFEYYFGEVKIGRKTIEMSIFQVSDDGYFVSNEEEKDMDDIYSYASSETSHSYLMFNISVHTTKYSNLWLTNPEFPNEDSNNFLIRFLESSKEVSICSNDKEHAIMKKYVMQNFTSQEETDKVIRDFAKLVKDNTGVEFFKDVFYRDEN